MPWLSSSERLFNIGLYALWVMPAAIIVTWVVWRVMVWCLYLSLLKNPPGHGIGLPMKAMIDDFGFSNRALLSRDPVSLYEF